MKKFTYSYYNPYEYPDDIMAAGTCGEVIARSITDAFALAFENVPIECLETLQIDGVSFKGYVASTSLRDWLKDRLFTMFVKGELHLLSDDSFKIIRNL